MDRDDDLTGRIEGEAVARECTQMVLSTHSFQAPGYLARGYVGCGRFPNCPAGHSQLHLGKALTGHPWKASGSNRRPTDPEVAAGAP